MRETEARDANSAPYAWSVRPDRRNQYVNTATAKSRTAKVGNACVSAIEPTSRDTPSTAYNPVSGATIENPTCGAARHLGLTR